MNSQLQWITVPGGIIQTGVEREAVLRVLIAPRLIGESLRTESMEHWPPQDLMMAEMTVNFAKSVDGPLHTVTVQAPHVLPRPGAWEAFFGPDTILTSPTRRARDERRVKVEETSRLARDIKTTFRTAASTVLAGEQDHRAAVSAAVRGELMSLWGGSQPPAAPAGGAQPSPGRPDFHQTIAMLREHPAVLRALGLIFELKIPIAQLPTGFSEGVVQVLWATAPDSLPEIVSPWTRYGSQFLPASTTNISAGMVTLTEDRPAGTAPSHPRWEVVIFDVDNGAGHLRDAARALGSSVDSASDPKLSIAMPALRTTGLQLVRRGRQEDFEQRHEAANANAQRSMREAVLTADDLVLGYRIDIKPQGREWLSLHLRDANYSVSRDGSRVEITQRTVREEGHVKAHAAIDDGGESLRADEVVASWKGWSLSVPRPKFGESLDFRRNRSADFPYSFDWSLTVTKNTLPRLRFAHNYRMRARVADIAGGGLELNDLATDRCFTDAIVYQRYEPIAPPDLLLPRGVDPATLGPGESFEHVVIHSDATTSAEASSARASRLLVVPRTSLSLAEQHHALDHMTPEQVRALMQQALANPSNEDGASPDTVLVPDFAAGGVCVFPRREPGGLNLRLTERAWRETWPARKPKEIVLRDRMASDQPVLEWQSASIHGNPNIGDRLIVRLAKGEEVTLEVSSFLKADLLDHFAIKDNSFPSESEAIANQGRHPMISPARLLRLTHAVRRPVKPSGTLRAKRKEGETFATLVPSPALLSVDRKSTGMLEIAATSIEPGRDSMPTMVQSIPIHRGDEVLETIRHEFGDTRYRKVNYTLSAVSRFRQFFAPSESDDAFVARTVLSEPVIIPNSARPSPPFVISTRPAFAWNEEREVSPEFKLARRRGGGCVRVELQGPWNETGEGEQLAVIVRPELHFPKEMWPFLTQTGMDPVHHGDLGIEDPRPFPERFPAPAAFAGGSSQKSELLKEARTEVVVIPFEPYLLDGRLFADIEVRNVLSESTAEAFEAWPFIQLALCRYQPESIRGCALSPVVRTEMISLMPERTLTVTRSGNDVFVTLEGRQAVGGRNEFAVFLERFQGPAGMPADAAALTSLTSQSFGIPAWVRVDEPGAMARGTIGPNGSRCRLQIRDGIGHMRIRIHEYEMISGPDGSDVDVNHALAGRTVYSDTVLLS